MLKTVNIITTAALPWRTGTAILALLRAFFLAQRGLDVLLYVPWIPATEQPLLFGEDVCFKSTMEQEECIRSHLPQPKCASLQIKFYPATYKSNLGSILPTRAISKKVLNCDWLILEEPEHLNWKHPWNRFHLHSSHVTGIVLTNYPYYIKQAQPLIPFLPWLVGLYNRWLIRFHCNDVIRPSNAIPEFPDSQSIHINGIHPSFLKTPFIHKASKKIYYIGKLIWDKGFRELIDLLPKTNIKEMDIFGIGKDQATIETYALSNGIKFNYKGVSTDPALDLRDYKIFINTSRSEVICTTTAEALGQGRFVILPSDPSNDGYRKFKNCLVYDTPEQFYIHLKFALTHLPEMDEQVKELTWEAATDRLLGFYHNKRNKLKAHKEDVSIEKTDFN
jgi:digalactosyldiacylglycerol synthase